MKKKTKAQLQKIMREGYRARDELQAREADQTDKRNAKLVGRHFKYRNSYGSSSPDWWLYGRVVAVKDGHLQMFKFQTDCHGQIEITPVRMAFLERISEGWQEITKDEFEEAWADVQRRIALAHRGAVNG